METKWHAWRSSVSVVNHVNTTLLMTALYHMETDFTATFKTPALYALILGAGEEATSALGALGSENSMAEAREHRVEVAAVQNSLAHMSMPRRDAAAPTPPAPMPDVPPSAHKAGRRQPPLSPPGAYPRNFHVQVLEVPSLVRKRMLVSQGVKVGGMQGQ